MLRKRRYLRAGEEDLDPLSGVANLVDAMLVFACGLIVVLILSWNLHSILLSDMTEAEKEEVMRTISRVVQVRQGEELDRLPRLAQGQGEGYQEMGTVYMDPRTGKLIMVTGYERENGRTEERPPGGGEQGQ